MDKTLMIAVALVAVEVFCVLMYCRWMCKRIDSRVFDVECFLRGEMSYMMGRIESRTSADHDMEKLQNMDVDRFRKAMDRLQGPKRVPEILAALERIEKLVNALLPRENTAKKLNMLKDRFPKLVDDGMIKPVETVKVHCNQPDTLVVRLGKPIDRNPKVAGRYLVSCTRCGCGDAGWEIMFWHLNPTGWYTIHGFPFDGTVHAYSELPTKLELTDESR